MNATTPENEYICASAKNLPFDEANFGEFFKKHFLSLCAYCQFKYGLDLDMAKEVVHTGFIKLWDARETLAGVSPKSYLYRIITNNILDMLKHRKIIQRHVEFVLHAVPEDAEAYSFDDIDVKQLQADIETSIEELPEQMRRIFELSRFEGLKYAEIASQLHISVKTVETQISRALAKLRVKLAAYLSCYIILLTFNVLLNK